MILIDESGDSYPRYVVENVSEALSPGEWYLDRSSGRLHYWPRPGETPDTAEVVAARATELLRLEGRPDQGQHVEGLRFEGLSFAHADWEPSQSVQAAFKVPPTSRRRSRSAFGRSISRMSVPAREGDGRGRRPGAPRSG